MTEQDHLKTLKWIYNAIADFDLLYYKEDKNRVAKSLDLLSTIKDSCYMNIHPDLFKRD